MSNVKSCNVPNPYNRKLKMKSEWIWGYLFVAPIMIGIAVFAVGPLLYSFYMSVMDWNGLSDKIFIGFDNYKNVFSDKTIGREFINTLYYALGTIPLSLILSILLANILNQKLSGVSLYRTIFFLPSVTMPAAIAIVWKWLFNSKIGLVNMFLGLFHIPGIIWLGDTRYIMPAIIIVSIWGCIGYNMVILLAGLQGIPQSFYEASVIDGATKWNKLVKITLPMLTPSIFFLLTMSLMNAFKAFDVIYMFSGAANATQGPLLEATRTMVYGVYEKGFTFLRIGYASAEAVVLFAIILFVTALQFIFQKKWVHYE